MIQLCIAYFDVFGEYSSCQIAKAYDAPLTSYKEFRFMLSFFNFGLQVPKWNLYATYIFFIDKKVAQKSSPVQKVAESRPGKIETAIRPQLNCFSP